MFESLKESFIDAIKKTHDVYKVVNLFKFEWKVTITTHRVVIRLGWIKICLIFC